MAHSLKPAEIRHCLSSRGAIFLAKKLKFLCSGTIRSDDAAVPQAESGYSFESHRLNKGQD